MPIQHIHAFLVHPKKGNKDKSQHSGTDVPMSGTMFDFMSGIYSKSATECEIDITFLPTREGKAQNDCRDLFIKYLSSPSLATGKPIAERLGETTDQRSGLGLLFLIVGKEGKEYKLVISRFPTDSAIYVEEKSPTLTVQFLDRVFMKNKFSYKAVLYQDTSLKAGFWTGQAIDKQSNSPSSPTSDYWIEHFLLSAFAVTSAQGTSRFARALRIAVCSDVSVETKGEITAAIKLFGGLGGKKMSINQILTKFDLSDETQLAIKGALKKPSLANEVFIFDTNKFKSIVAFKSVEMDNGAILMAASDKFDDVFQREEVNKSTAQVQYITRGRVINEKIRTKA